MPSDKSLIRLSLQLVPFAGIAFLWFIGVIREQLGEVEDRLFSTVFLGSGLLFLAMLFIGAVTSTSLLALLTGSDPNAELFAYSQQHDPQTLIWGIAMRMAAVFTISVSTLGLRTAGLPRWVSFLGYLVALRLLVAAGEHRWFQLLVPAWVLLVSIVILVIRPPVRTADPDSAVLRTSRLVAVSPLSPRRAPNGARTGRFGRHTGTLRRKVDCGIAEDLFRAMKAGSPSTRRSYARQRAGVQWQGAHRTRRGGRQAARAACRRRCRGGSPGLRRWRSRGRKDVIDVAVAAAAPTGVEVRRGAADRLTAAAALGAVVDALPELDEMVGDPAGVDRFELFVGTGPCSRAGRRYWCWRTCIGQTKRRWIFFTSLPSTVGPAGVPGRHLPAGGRSATPCLLGDVGCSRGSQGVDRINLAPLSLAGVREFLASSSFGVDAELCTEHRRQPVLSD